MKSFSDHELFLYFGYLPRFSEASLDWLNCDFENTLGEGIESKSWWVDEGVKALSQTMANEIGSTDGNPDHIVLLSGGMDSRAILGGLLENVPKSRIIAATYGIPGAWDYEFAKIITSKFGLRHEVINLTEEKWDIGDLVKAAARLEYPVSVYQSYARQKINDRFGSDCIYWSGFMGDMLSGYDLLKIPNREKRAAIIRFLREEPTRNYKNQEFEAEMVEEILDEFPWDRVNQSRFCLDQQLNFCLRQRYLIQSLVIVPGFNFKVPFLNRVWVNFISNTPHKLQLEQYIYKRIIQESYKELSKIPSTTNAGMSLYASKYEVYLGKAIARVKPYLVQRDSFYSHPRTNYINWTEALRHKGPLQETVYITLQDLKKRGIFDNKEIDGWWTEHLNRKLDCTTLLMNLSSLELLLKAGVLDGSVNAASPGLTSKLSLERPEVI